jgi:hypothetical protein
MRFRLVSIALLTVAASACPPLLPDPPKQCDPTGSIGGQPGCLSDEICVDFKCIPRPKCELDADCPSVAFECVRPAQICELREGFGQECSEPEAPCGLDEFCALGVCLSRADARNCVDSLECSAGQRCDPVHLFCITATDCRLASEFPEAACHPDPARETCDALTGQCNFACQNQCTPGADDCPGDLLCDGSCRCVDCISDDNCGPGLICDQRRGQCRSEDLCESDEDCAPPLICGSSTQCEVAPPACFDDFDCGIAEACDIATGRCVLPEGDCERDYFEESDTPANAEPLDTVTEVYDDLRLCPDDDDVFSIFLQTGDQLTATIVVPAEDGGAQATIWLYDETAENSLRFAQAPPFGSGRILYVAQEDGVVYLRINALNGQARYDLIIEIDTATPCQADFFEPNNSTTSPTSPDLVPDGVNLSGTICPGDVDFFQVPVAAGEALNAVLTFNSTESDLDIAFLDENGVLIAQDAGGGSPEQLRRRFTSNTTVFMRVRGFGTSTGSYTLTVDHEPPFVCTADAAEPDNDVATARPVALNGGLPSEARTICQGDEDFLSLPLEDFERVIVRALYEDTDVEIAIDILDPTGENVLATSPPATGGAAISYDAVGDETVIARVRGAGGAIGPYTLSVTKENQLTCTPDSSEPNDDVAVASELPEPSDLLSICESDQDFFAIDGIADKKLIVDASFRQADGDIDLMLLGLDGAQILAVADGTSDGEHLEFILPLDGTYTLRVFSLTSGAKASYSLAVTQVSP